MNYYNEIDPYCIAWLKNLIAAGIIPRGDVDGRRIEKVRPHELNGYTHCHFFAGIGGWAYAARLAGWPEWKPLWTGSCPCQPFSGAGQRKGVSDPRHLWPHFHRIIREQRPSIVMGEQVAGTAGYDWFFGVRADLAKEGYRARAVDIPACSVNAPHIRNRLYWVAHSSSARRQQVAGGASPYEAAHGGAGWDGGQPGSDHKLAGDGQGDRFWNNWELIGPDSHGKYRRVKPGVRLVADGIPARIPKLRSLGNSIVIPQTVEVIKAYMEAYDVDL